MHSKSRWFVVDVALTLVAVAFFGCRSPHAVETPELGVVRFIAQLPNQDDGMLASCATGRAISETEPVQYSIYRGYIGPRVAVLTATIGGVSEASLPVGEYHVFAESRIDCHWNEHGIEHVQARPVSKKVRFEVAAGAPTRISMTLGPSHALLVRVLRVGGVNRNSKPNGWIRIQGEQEDGLPRHLGFWLTADWPPAKWAEYSKVEQRPTELFIVNWELGRIRLVSNGLELGTWSLIPFGPGCTGIPLTIDLQEGAIERATLLLVDHDRGWARRHNWR
tara:strand:+ start:3225 stop:4058 length:834 start_codon:yes stop_codon:yes gene_type:complete